MFVAILAVVGLIVAGAVLLAEHHIGMPSEGRLATAQECGSPVDEAERILARRYVIGEITAHEYERMMAILRR